MRRRERLRLEAERVLAGIHTLVGFKIWVDSHCPDDRIYPWPEVHAVRPTGFWDGRRFLQEGVWASDRIQRVDVPAFSMQLAPRDRTMHALQELRVDVARTVGRTDIQPTLVMSPRTFARLQEEVAPKPKLDLTPTAEEQAHEKACLDDLELACSALAVA